MLCENAKSLEMEYGESSAVFLAELIEIKNVVIDTTHHGEKVYLTGEFKVIGSWKTVDREFVMVYLPGKTSACADFNEGSRYLIFAKQMGTDLHVAVDSRSSLASSDLARGDLNQLGTRKIPITRGEFSLKKDPTFEVLMAFLIIAALALVFLFWVRKQRCNDF